MDHVSSRVTLVTLAVTIGCTDDCESRCYNEYIDCTKTAQTTDERAACQQAFHTCYWSCPKTIPQPQYDDPPDE
jgi:hypothetical protein